ncbi:stage III sporulation protein AF [Vallitalea guaymasensis]|uniref:Stage III sporulation protein AF n=1 Tax=Vallitalea guaymasensis TaxID=1185412 RepID=A0A8J8MDY0_9FIRM|nr:stage III sporulation protein AF [Vallitalea guaymasensis]QUH31048.1 stage III sporulation protein AF [Vallitalea guaymasensis]
MEAFYSFIKNIVIFLLLAKILEYLIPGGNMKKYFRLFSGIILMIIIINPIIKYNGILEQFNYDVIKNQFKINYTDTQETENKYANVQNEITLKIYKDKIINHVKGLLEAEKISITKASVEIEEDIKNENYGTIKEINLTVNSEYIEKKDSQIDRVEIEKIIIGESNDNRELRSSEDILLEKKIKKIIKNFYKLSSNNIHITIETC